MHHQTQRAALVALAMLIGAAATVASEPTVGSSSRSFRTGLYLDGSTGYLPNGQAMADFDGDGDVDLAIANVGNFITPQISLLFNRGDGTYAAPVNRPVPTETTDVIAADWNGDRVPDLAFCEGAYGSSGQRVLILLNDGHGSFAEQHRFLVGKGPTGLVAVDVDRDGDLDLATANSDFNEEDLSVLLNDGHGNFGARVDLRIAGQQPYKIAAGDLDRDGYADLVATVRGTPAIYVLLNDHNGGFRAPVSYASASGSPVPGVAVGDVDRDGNLDVVYASDGATPPNYESTLALFRNRGDGTLKPAEAILAASVGAAHEIVIADVTRDGWPDLVAVGHSSPYGWVLVPGNGAGGFKTATSFRAGEMSRAIDVADVDRDGDGDVVVVNTGSLTVTVHENVAGTFVLPAVYATGGVDTMESDAADIDGDGDQDLVALDANIYTLRNHGDGTFNVSGAYSGKGILDHPKLRDLDGDGHADLLMLKNTTTGSGPYDLYTSMNQGDGTFAPAVTWSLASYGTGDVQTLDADGDGDLDVVVSEFLGGPGQDQRVFYYLANQGNGQLEVPVLIPHPQGRHARHFLTGDFDGDGNPDILGGHGDEVGFWQGHGDGTFSAPLVSDSGNGTGYMTAADLNGDHVLDVALTGEDPLGRGETLAVLFGYGDGTFTAPAISFGMFSLQYSGALGLQSADLDLDGDIDLVAGAYGANDIAVWENRGVGTFAPEERYGVDGYVTFVTLADLNGDARPDVAANIGMGPPLQGAMSILLGQRGQSRSVPGARRAR